MTRELALDAGGGAGARRRWSGERGRAPALRRPGRGRARPRALWLLTRAPTWTQQRAASTVASYRRAWRSCSGLARGRPPQAHAGGRRAYVRRLRDPRRGGPGPLRERRGAWAGSPRARCRRRRCGSVAAAGVLRGHAVVGVDRRPVRRGRAPRLTERPVERAKSKAYTLEESSGWPASAATGTTGWLLLGAHARLRVSGCWRSPGTSTSGPGA